MKNYILLKSLLSSAAFLFVTQLQAELNVVLPQASSKASMDAVMQPECPILLQDAEAALERGLQLNGMKRWKEAAPFLREANRSLIHTAANCPGLAAQANGLGEKADRELKLAESSSSHLSDCQPRLEKALDLDIRASSAKRENRDPAEIEQLFGQAEAGWREAMALCQSPHREKAERSLAATVRARAANAENLSSGPACDGAWKSASTLIDLAKSAWKEKHWEDAAMLYNKATMAWEAAGEKCSGPRQQLAAKKLEQTIVDAHNAEYCGPQWEEASELTQHSKASQATASVTDREIQSVKAEVAWRDAIVLCRGVPQSMAKTNAEAIARERGAPVPPLAMEKFGKKPVFPGGIERLATLGLVKVDTPGLDVSAKGVSPAVSPVVNKAAPIATATAALPIAPDSKEPQSATPASDQVIVAGDMTYRGAFTVDPKTREISGNGDFELSNGERYSGSVVEGKRHGNGRYSWKNRQVYDGEWKNDQADGRGVIQFNNGNRYEGSVHNGEPNGRGTLIYPMGDRYSGDFLKGVFHGHGSYYWKNGNRYDGAWVAGNKHGKGRFTWAMGDGWEGEFRNDQQTDEGETFSAVAKTAASVK